MFGYLKAPCRSCLGPDAAPYRSYFCGLSNALKNDYGAPARFLVNRDSAFISLLTAAQTRWNPVPAITTCCNPFSKTRPIFQNDAPARYAAAITICGLITKLADDEADHKGLRRFWSRKAGSLLQHWNQTAARTLSEFEFPTRKVQACLSNQEKFEIEALQGVRSFEDVSRPTREAFGQILRHSAIISDAPTNQGPLQTSGESLGELIYWNDARDDFAKDQLRGHFNPLVDPEARDTLGVRLTHSATTLLAASSQLKLYRSQSLIDHILQSSLEENPSKKKKKKKKKSRKKNDCSCCDCCSCDCSLPSCSDSNCDCCGCDC